MPDHEQTDFAALAQRARQMRGEMEQVSDELMAIQATGHGGGGLVTATISGEGRLLGLRIDPSVVDPNDPETLAEMVIEAVNGASQTIKEQHAERISEITGSVSDLLAGLRRDRVVPSFAIRPPAAPATRPVRPFAGPK